MLTRALRLAYARQVPGQWAPLLRLEFMPAVNQQQVLGLLFSPTTGVGMNILRLGISSTSSSIEPTNPGGPNATHR